MIIQHILSIRMGTREVIHDSSDEEDETEEKPKTEETNKKTELESKDKIANEIEAEKAQKEAGEAMEPQLDSTTKETQSGEKEAVKPEETKAEIPELEKGVVSNETLKKDEAGECTKRESAEEKSEPVTGNAGDGKKSEEDDDEINALASLIGKKLESESNEDSTDSPVVTPVEESKMETDVTGENAEAPLKVEESSKVVDSIKTEVVAPVKEETSIVTKPPKSPKKKREPETVEVEEFYVKYKNFSYLHCEWKTEEELMKGDKRANAKIKRYKQKMSNNSNIFEFLEEEPFNPDYIEVDRLLDMSEVEDPTTGKVTRNYLVKWRSLPYEESTWELSDDIDVEKIHQFEMHNKLPPKDQWKPKRRPKAADWKKIETSPVYKNGNTLREYQLEGLNWLSFSWFNGRNCILADEMGLGKTIQSLTFVDNVYKCGIRGPFLIIAPLSTVPNWQREFETWTDLNVVVYHGSVASRNMLQEYESYYRHPDNPETTIKDLYKFNVLITTFEIVLTDVMELRDYPWRLCIIDEAHRLKNKNCKLLEGLRLLNLEHRVLLSGTPLQNNVNELFSLLNFLEPAQFSSSENFVKEFGELKTETQVQKLQALLKPMMLRRLKEDVEKSIAPKEETIIEVRKLFINNAN